MKWFGRETSSFAEADELSSGRLDALISRSRAEQSLYPPKEPPPERAKIKPIFHPPDDGADGEPA